MELSAITTSGFQLQQLCTWIQTWLKKEFCFRVLISTEVEEKAFVPAALYLCCSINVYNGLLQGGFNGKSNTMKCSNWKRDVPETQHKHSLTLSQGQSAHLRPNEADKTILEPQPTQSFPIHLRTPANNTRHQRYFWNGQEPELAAEYGFSPTVIRCQDHVLVYQYSQALVFRDGSWSALWVQNWKDVQVHIMLSFWLVCVWFGQKCNCRPPGGWLIL